MATDNLPIQGTIKVGSEEITYTGRSSASGAGNLTGATRGANSTSAASHTGGGPLTGILITNGGSGYSSAPTVGFTGGGGSSAAATATITAGIVTLVTITNAGSGYTSTPTISFSGGGGSNAAATARVAGTVGLVRNAVKVHGWRIEDLALFSDQLTPITIDRVMQGYANDNTSWLGSPKNPKCIDAEITVGKT